MPGISWDDSTKPAIEAEWKDEADKPPTHRPGALEELPVEGGAGDLHQQTGLQVANENRMGGHMPGRDRGYCLDSGITWSDERR